MKIIAIIFSLLFHAILFINFATNKSISANSEDSLPSTITTIKFSNITLGQESKTKQISKRKKIFKGKKTKNKANNEHYLLLVREEIFRRHKMPKAAKFLKMNGRVDVKLIILKSGIFKILALKGSHPIFEKEARTLFKSIGRFASTPSDLVINIPLEYDIR